MRWHKRWLGARALTRWHEAWLGASARSRILPAARWRDTGRRPHSCRCCRSGPACTGGAEGAGTPRIGSLRGQGRGAWEPGG
jgi:hypothetical protein